MILYLILYWFAQVFFIVFYICSYPMLIPGIYLPGKYVFVYVSKYKARFNWNVYFWGFFVFFQSFLSENSCLWIHCPYWSYFIHWLVIVRCICFWLLTQAVHTRGTFPLQCIYITVYRNSLLYHCQSSIIYMSLTLGGIHLFST